MQSAKEKAANAAASAKAGMEKTKATMQEKGERMTTRDPLHKEMATEKKEDRIYEAEWQKQEARDENATTRQPASGGGTFGHDDTTGATGTGHLRGLGSAEDPNVGGGARPGYGSGNTY